MVRDDPGGMKTPASKLSWPTDTGCYMTNIDGTRMVREVHQGPRRGAESGVMRRDTYDHAKRAKEQGYDKTWHRRYHLGMVVAQAE